MRKVNELMDLSHKRSLIIGGAGHVGQAAAQALLELGAQVALLDRDLESAQTQAGQLNQDYPNSVTAYGCDLLDEQSTRQTIKATLSNLGGLDILIHTAAFIGLSKIEGWAVPFAQQQVPVWDDALRVNLTSAFIAAQETQEALSASGNGSIVLMGSIYGMIGPDMSLYDNTPLANPLAYGASKGGLLQLTRYLATLLAPTIRVNLVSPGGIKRGQPDIFIDRYEQRTPLKRMAIEEDVKGAIAYLASDLSSYVTGHNLVIDGGWTVW
jgi:NAD(P)-dependent dehydrogenase (short-subunit alcohol dehydrogenase family)